jgi:hypothetical protein
MCIAPKSPSSLPGHLPHCRTEGGGVPSCSLRVGAQPCPSQRRSLPCPLSRSVFVPHPRAPPSSRRPRRKLSLTPVGETLKGALSAVDEPFKVSRRVRFQAREAFVCACTPLLMKGSFLGLSDTGQTPLPARLARDLARWPRPVPTPAPTRARKHTPWGTVSEHEPESRLKTLARILQMQRRTIRSNQQKKVRLLPLTDV